MDEIVDILGRELKKGDRVLYGMGFQNATLEDGIILDVVSTPRMRWERDANDNRFQVQDGFDHKLQIQVKDRAYDAATRTYVPTTRKTRIEYNQWRFVRVDNDAVVL